MEYQVRTRYGWGWEVTGSNGYCSHPIETSIAAQQIADALNAGTLFADAMANNKLRFENGRIYATLSAARK